MAKIVLGPIKKNRVYAALCRIFWIIDWYYDIENGSNEFLILLFILSTLFHKCRINQFFVN